MDISKTISIGFIIYFLYRYARTADTAARDVGIISIAMLAWSIIGDLLQGGYLRSSPEFYYIYAAVINPIVLVVTLVVFTIKVLQVQWRKKKP